MSFKARARGLNAPSEKIEKSATPQARHTQRPCRTRIAGPVEVTETAELAIAPHIYFPSGMLDHIAVLTL